LTNKLCESISNDPDAELSQVQLIGGYIRLYTLLLTLKRKVMSSIVTFQFIVIRRKKSVTLCELMNRNSNISLTIAAKRSKT